MRTILIELTQSLANYEDTKAIFDAFSKDGHIVSCAMDPDVGLITLTVASITPQQRAFLDDWDDVYDWSNMPAMQDLVSDCAHHIHVTPLEVPCSGCGWQCARYGCYECGKRLCVSCVQFGKDRTKFCAVHGGIA
jgi:hypothetical protein